MVGIVVLALFCAFVLPRVTRWVFAGVGQHRGARFLFVAVALTAAALVADRAGIEGSNEDKGHEAVTAAVATAATLRSVSEPWR